MTSPQRCCCWLHWPVAGQTPDLIIDLPAVTGFNESCTALVSAMSMTFVCLKVFSLSLLAVQFASFFKRDEPNWLTIFGHRLAPVVLRRLP